VIWRSGDLAIWRSGDLVVDPRTVDLLIYLLIYLVIW
jgi:hypothetical protein